MLAPTSFEPEESELHCSASSTNLLQRARRGDRSAVDALFARYFPWLRRWARGRLPVWARGAIDTSDLVQDALLRTFARLTEFQPKRNDALRAYLRLAIDNRVRDEMRRITRRPNLDVLDGEDMPADDSASPFQRFVDEETWARYRDGLKRLTPRERRLIVGRAELGYTYKQLALVDDRASPDAARIALRRALVRLGSAMPDG